MLHRFDPFQDFDWMSRPMSGTRGFMSADIYRADDNYYVSVDVPGIDEEKIDVTLEKKTLTVTVERPDLLSEETTMVSRGRPVGTFTRRFYLGEGLDPENIEATLNNGVLTIAIPVGETAKARKIEIGTVRTAIGS